MDPSGGPRFGRDLYYQAFLTSPASIGIVTLHERRFVEVNRGFMRLFGYEPGEVVGRTAAELRMDVNRESWLVLFQRLREGEVVREMEMRVRTKVGDVRTVLGSFVPVEAEGGVYVINKLIDITELRELEREVVEVSAREQRRIGQDLHDDLGQRLTALSLQAGALQQRLADAGHAEAAAAKVAAAASTIAGLARRLAHGLLPAEIVRSGLCGALALLADTVGEQHGVACRLHCELAGTLDPVAAAHLYRIAQEAVQNAVRHGQPRTVGLTVQETVDTLVLTVVDDGDGISDAALEVGAGHGLRTMQYRARLVNAILEIGRTDEGGTTVTCWVPLAQIRAKEAAEENSTGA
ncbi:MAG: PAS domain S-box protein [Rhodothermales bacterium]|nr:PAS domain S-box protein [Rhodothermales bacterium]